MSNHHTALAALADNTRALGEPQTHVEPYQIRSTTSTHQRNYLNRTHRTTHPSLLDQLRECRYDRPQTATEAANRDAQTVPHIDLDAIDRLVAIQTAVNKWLTELEINSRAAAVSGEINRRATDILRLFPDIRQVPKEILRACALLRAGSSDVAKRFDLDLPALVGAAAAALPGDTTLAKQLAGDTGRWATWCRIMVGWEDPPWRPRARCPQCDAAAGIDVDEGRPSGLRVRSDIRSAVCLTCDSTWSDDEGGVPIEVLAEHIRQTSEAPLTADQFEALRDPGKAAVHQNRGGKA